MAKSKQLSFPGMKVYKTAEEPKVRLSCAVAVKIKDNWTGETFSVNIPVETDDGDRVARALTDALQHHRSAELIVSFGKDRRGDDQLNSPAVAA